MFIAVLQLDEVAASSKFRIEVDSGREKYGCQSLSTEVLIHQEEIWWIHLPRDLVPNLDEEERNVRRFILSRHILS